MDGHLHCRLHDCLTHVVQTEEFLDDVQQQLVQEAHVQKRVGGVTEHIAFERRVVDLRVDDVKKHFGRLEVEDAHQTLGHVQLRLQVLFVQLVALHMHSYCLGRVLKDLLFIDVQKIKRDVISIGFDGVCKELNFERNLGLLNELKRESESFG